MIKTSVISLKNSNENKKNLYYEFLTDYNESLSFYIDYIWDNLVDKNYNCPKYVSDKNVKPITTKLSARALKCCATQAIGIVKSSIEKQRKILYIKSNINADVKLNNISKPTITTIVGAELNSICCDYKDISLNFDGFIQLKSIGKYYGKIRIPVKKHRHFNKMVNNGGTLMNSFLFKKEYIDFRFKFIVPSLNDDGSVIGVDQGMNSVVTLSDGQQPNRDNHGHTYKSILKKMANKKKGSKSFKKSQIHRDNFINWSINQLNFSEIKEIRFEKIKNMRKGKKTSRYLSHFNYTAIKTKIKSFCEINGVRFVEQDNKFRSQRCFECGFVHKYNRKSEIFVCRSCAYETNADINAAKNHSIDLPKIPPYIWQHKMNLKGFHWNVDSDFTVPNE